MARTMIAADQVRVGDRLARCGSEIVEVTSGWTYRRYRTLSTPSLRAVRVSCSGWRVAEWVPPHTSGIDRWL